MEKKEKREECRTIWRHIEEYWEIWKTGQMGRMLRILENISKSCNRGKVRKKGKITAMVIPLNVGEYGKIWEAGRISERMGKYREISKNMEKYLKI